jgi:hypothetical protein
MFCSKCSCFRVVDVRIRISSNAVAFMCGGDKLGNNKHASSVSFARRCLYRAGKILLSYVVENQNRFFGQDLIVVWSLVCLAAIFFLGTHLIVGPILDTTFVAPLEFRIVFLLGLDFKKSDQNGPHAWDKNAKKPYMPLCL